jgi:hypothetical protein
VLRHHSELYHRLEAIFIFVIANIRMFHGIRIIMNIVSEQNFSAPLGRIMRDPDEKFEVEQLFGRHDTRGWTKFPTRLKDENLSISQVP